MKRRDLVLSPTHFHRKGLGVVRSPAHRDAPGAAVWSWAGNQIKRSSCSRDATFRSLFGSLQVWPGSARLAQKLWGGPEVPAAGPAGGGLGRGRRVLDPRGYIRTHKSWMSSGTWSGLCGARSGTHMDGRARGPDPVLTWVENETFGPAGPPPDPGLETAREWAEPVLNKAEPAWIHERPKDRSGSGEFCSCASVLVLVRLGLQTEAPGCGAGRSGWTGPGCCSCCSACCSEPAPGPARTASCRTGTRSTGTAPTPGRTRTGTGPRPPQNLRLYALQGWETWWSCRFWARSVLDQNNPQRFRDTFKTSKHENPKALKKIKIYILLFYIFDSDSGKFPSWIKHFPHFHFFLFSSFSFHFNLHGSNEKKKMIKNVLPLLK